jgi:hypothetical protein
MFWYETELFIVLDKVKVLRSLPVEVIQDCVFFAGCFHFSKYYAVKDSHLLYILHVCGMQMAKRNQQ